MPDKNRFSVVAADLAIRKSLGACSAELTGNALLPCFAEGEYPEGYVEARYVEQVVVPHLINALRAQERNLSF